MFAKGALSSAADAAHRGNDIGIGPAAADVAAHAFSNRVVVLAAGLFQQRHCGHDLPRRAIPALKSVVLQESRLHGVKFAILCETFDGGDLIALMHDREGEAGIHAASIDVNGASAALAVVAALFRSKKTKIFPQRV